MLNDLLIKFQAGGRPIDQVIISSTEGTTIALHGILELEENM